MGIRHVIEWEIDKAALVRSIRGGSFGSVTCTMVRRYVDGDPERYRMFHHFHGPHPRAARRYDRGSSVQAAMAACILGNMLPMPFVLLLITKIFDLLKKTKAFKPLVEKLEAHAMGKKDRIEKYEFWGLVLFVGIPLPGTGGWTGSLAAAVLGVRFKKAFPAVILGILLAATIMSVVSYVIPWVIRVL